MNVRLNRWAFVLVTVTVGCSRASSGDEPVGARVSAVPAKPTTVRPVVDPPSVPPAAPAAQPRGPYVPSPIPTDAEYAAVREVTVRHSSSLGCETKQVREWLRVQCTSRNPADTASVGGLSAEVAPGSRPGGARVFNFKNPFGAYLPVVPGASHRASFTGDWGTRYLTVTWPIGAPAPTMAFDQPAEAPSCRGPSECPGQVCCSVPGGRSFCAQACDLGLQAQVCVTDTDCLPAFGRATRCAGVQAGGLRTCQ